MLRTAPTTSTACGTAAALVRAAAARSDMVMVHKTECNATCQKYRECSASSAFPVSSVHEFRIHTTAARSSASSPRTASTAVAKIENTYRQYVLFFNDTVSSLEL